MQSGSFDVVIVPPADIGQQAIDLSHLVTQWNTYFTLDESGPYPHISLYQTEFPLANLEDIKSKLSAYAKLKKPLEISPVDGVYRKEDKDFLEVQYKQTDELYKLHKDVIELLNPLRDGLMRTRDKERFEDLPRPLQENLERWGYRLTGAAFRPHMTLSRLRNPDSVSPTNLPEKDFAFTVGQIGIFELGEHGTCTKQVAIYDLSD